VIPLQKLAGGAKHLYNYAHMKPFNLFTTLRSIVFAIILSLGLGYAYAWTGPTAPAPGNNTPAPINEGAFNQLKNAGLSLNTLAVFGNALVGKLQLSDVSIEGAACSPNGTLSRNTTGETLACVSGIWTKASGGSGGGAVALAKFQGDVTGTLCTLLSSYNVASCNHVGFGSYRINLINPIPANAVLLCSASDSGWGSADQRLAGCSMDPTNTIVSVHTFYPAANQLEDGSIVSLAIFDPTGSGGGGGSGGGKAVGEVFPFAGATCPSGSLLANGSTFSAATYPALNTLLGGNTLPDLRGEFIRGLDNGRGVDGGRVLGSAQADMFKSHTHDQAPNTEIAFGPTMREVNGSGDAGITVGGTTQATGGSETRPRNVAMNMCINAIAGGGSSGMPDFSTGVSYAASINNGTSIVTTPTPQKLCIMNVSGGVALNGACNVNRNPDGTWRIQGNTSGGSVYCEMMCYN